MIDLNELSAKCRFLTQINSAVCRQWEGRKARKIFREWSAKSAVGVNGFVRSAATWIWKSSSLSFCSSLFWGLGEHPGRKGCGTLLLILTMGFLFRKNAAKVSFQRPEWILEARARKKARGKNLCTLWWLSTPFFPADLPEFLAKEEGAAPGRGVVTSACTTALPDPREFLCVQFLAPTCPPEQLWAALWLFTQSTGKGFPGKCALLVVCTLSTSTARCCSWLFVNVRVRLA